MQSIAEALGGLYNPFDVVRLGVENPQVLTAWVQEQVGISGEVDRGWVDSIHRGALNSSPGSIDSEFILALQLARFPVSIETFLFDPYYLGKDRREIYPVVLDELKKINNPSGLRVVNPYTEGVFTGGIGSAKSTTALYTNAYQLYILSCFQDPHGAFSLDKSSEILFAFLSVAGDAAGADYARFYSMIKDSPYFNLDFPYNKRIKTYLEFPRMIQVVPSINTIGQNVIGGMIDEVNFGKTVQHSKKSLDGGAWDQTMSLYTSLSRRRKSRFMSNGTMPGILCLVSSKRYPGEFTDKKLEEAQSDPSIYVYDKRVWDIKPPHSYSGKKFRVFIGNSSAKAAIVEDDTIYTPEEREAIIEVPVEYLSDFEDDLPGSLRDIAGVGTLASYPFFQNVSAVASSFNRVQSVLSLEQSDLDTQPLEFFPNRFRDLQHKRWVHIDLGLVSDHCGVACGYVDKFILTPDAVCLMPNIKFDFVLRVAPPRNQEIKFYKIRRLLILLRESGLPIDCISFDSYQSVDSIQLLRAAGFRTGKQSVDNNPNFYAITKTAMYSGRVYLPRHTKCQEEFVRLEKDQKTGKVDHPPTGSKDCSDAVAGVVCGLTLSRSIWSAHGVRFSAAYSSLKEVHVESDFPTDTENASYLKQGTRE